MTVQTFVHQLVRHASQRPADAALREKAYGIWQTLSWSGLLERVQCMAHGLQALGVVRDDHIVVVGDNRPNLYVACLAAQVLGAVPIPLYQDAAASEYVFPLQNAAVRLAVVEDQEQVDKMLEVRGQWPGLEHILYDDGRGLREYGVAGLVSLESVMAQGAARRAQQGPSGPGDPAWDAWLKAVQPDHVAALFFTSGTTGQPKGVVHTHASLLDRAAAGAAFDRLTHREDVLAYLPMAWIGQNIFSFAQWLSCGYVVNCPESSDTVPIDLCEIGPTYYFAPPRVFEGLLTQVMIRMEDAGWIKRTLFKRSLALAKRVGPRRMGGEALSLADRVRYFLGDLLVYGPLRNTLGLSRVRVAYTAGEAIGPDLFEFYRAIGVNLKQLYGSTETAVFVCMQPDGEVYADTVGVPCQGVEIRLADNGEILVKSSGLLRGYYRNPAATEEVLDADGWYRTSDAGFFDARGHLKIIDRVKDVGKLSGGAFDGAMFAPKYVENKLKFFPYIKEAVALGHGRDRVCALVNIDFAAVGHWAERQNLAYTGYTDLALKPQVLQLVQDCVEQVNADLARDGRLAGSQISRFLVLHKELDADDGELTRTNKVRRGHIAEKYAVLVDALYGGLAEQAISTRITYEDGRQSVVSATLPLRDARRFDPVTAPASAPVAAPALGSAA